MISQTDERVLACTVAGLSLHVPVAKVERVIEEQGVIHMPFAASGLVGLLPVDDLLVPLYDLDAMSQGTRPEPRHGDFLLVAVFSDFAERVALRLDRVQGLPMAAPVRPSVAADTASLPPLLQDCISGITESDGLLAFVFAPERLARRLREAVALGLSDAGSLALIDDLGSTAKIEKELSALSE